MQTHAGSLCGTLLEANGIATVGEIVADMAALRKQLHEVSNMNSALLNGTRRAAIHLLAFLRLSFT